MKAREFEIHPPRRVRRSCLVTGLATVALLFVADAAWSNPARDFQATKKERVVRHQSRDVVALAERYIGTNPTKMRRLWCANFVGLMEKKVGRKGTGSNLARSYDRYGKKISRSEVRRGDIAVMKRGRRGGHVGYFVAWASKGKAILISGNSRGGKVSKGQYSVARIYAWRRPG